ncbi:TPA: NUMOD4 domain-containing protein [Bacillus cereus]
MNNYNNCTKKVQESQQNVMYKDLYVNRNLEGIILIEEWKSISITGGKYEISNTGKLRNTKTKRINKLQVNRDGYAYTTVIINGKHTKLYVHVEVAKAFLTPSEERTIVDHIKGKEDNSVLNLQYVTHTENLKLAYLRGERKAKLSEEDVKFIREHYMKTTQRKLAEMFNVSKTAIHNVIHNKTHVS